MVFRILTAALIVVSGVFFLTDTQRFTEADQLDHLNDQIVLELLYKKREAIARFDLEKVKTMYSKNIITEVVSPDGQVHRGGYQELADLIDDYARTGQGYEKRMLNHAVMVANDGQSALVRMEALESWRFKDEFRNVSGGLIETQRWALENGIPKITGIRKKHSIADVFYLQRREKQPSSSHRI